MRMTRPRSGRAADEELAPPATATLTVGPAVAPNALALARGAPFGFALPFAAAGAVPEPSGSGPARASVEQTTRVTPSRSSLYSASGLSSASSLVAFKRDSFHFSVGHRLTVSGGPVEGKQTTSKESSTPGVSGVSSPASASPSVGGEASSCSAASPLSEAADDAAGLERLPR